MTEITCEVRAAIEALATTWWQPRSGNERQSLGGRKGDLAREVGRYVALRQSRAGATPSRAHLFGAAAAIYRDPGKPWGSGRGVARVTPETYPAYEGAAEAIEAAVFGLVERR